MLGGGREEHTNLVYLTSAGDWEPVSVSINSQLWDCQDKHTLLIDLVHLNPILYGLLPKV